MGSFVRVVWKTIVVAQVDFAIDLDLGLGPAKQM